MNDTKQIKPRAEGIPLFPIVVICVLALAACIGWSVWQLRQANDHRAKLERRLEEVEMQRKQDELNRQKSELETKQAQALNQRNEALLLARNATNAVERLLGDIKRITSEAEILRTSEAGKQAALHPELIANAQHLYDYELRALPSAQEAITRLENARRIEQRLSSAGDSTFTPDPLLSEQLRQSSFWAEQGLSKAAQVQTLLSTLTQESKVKYTERKVTEKSPNLATALSQVKQAQETQRQTIISQEALEAQRKAAEAEAKANAERITKAAEAKAAQIVAAAEEQKKEVERELAKKQAESKTKDAVVMASVAKTENEADMIRLQQKANDPRVKGLLAPFITPGYWQANGKLDPSELKPLSFSQIKAAGALRADLYGKQELVDIARNSRDKVRPRVWATGNANTWRSNPKTIADIGEVQALLIELGPALVKMGWLLP